MNRVNKTHVLFLAIALILASVGLVVWAALRPVRVIAPGGLEINPAAALPASADDYTGWILFQSDREGGGLFARLPDETEIKPVADESIYQQARARESFSPDGFSQVFVRQGAESAELILRNNATGWTETLARVEGVVGQPAWSPLGDRIAFVAPGEGFTALHLFELETGSDLLLLTLPGEMSDPSWSPAGDRLVYAARQEGENFHLWLLDPNNPAPQPLSLDEQSWDPVWVKPRLAVRPTQTPGGLDDLGLALTLDGCSQRGELAISFLAWDNTYGADHITRVALEVNGVQVYETGMIQTERLSDTLNYIYLDTSTGTGAILVTLIAWNEQVFQEQPKLLNKSAMCQTAGVVPAQLKLLLPELGNPEETSLRPEAAATAIPLYAFQDKIIFRTDRDGDDALYMMNPDGSQQVRIDEDLAAAYQYSGSQENQAFSPDSSLLVFSERSQYEQSLFLYDVRSGWTWQLTRGYDSQQEPAWSPDGRWIAYTEDQSTQSDIALVDPITQQGMYVVRGEGYANGHPSWSPDGQQLVFWSDRLEGLRQVYRVNVDGSGLINLSQSSSNDWNPAWVHVPIALPTPQFPEETLP